MTLIEAMKNRHMVRKYKDISLSGEIVEKLNVRIKEHNKSYKLSIKLMVNDRKAVGAVFKLLFTKGVNNYFILAGDEAVGSTLEERLGYCGADLMLYAQALGMNTWYVGGVFNHGVGQFVKGKKVIGIIAVGYGRMQGIPHKSKKADDVSKYQGIAPSWFLKGIEASLLAPTAYNKQDYFITGDGNKVKIENSNGVYTGANRGLIKYHFELGAGKENFNWES